MKSLSERVPLPRKRQRHFRRDLDIARASIEGKVDFYGVIDSGLELVRIAAILKLDFFGVHVRISTFGD